MNRITQRKREAIRTARHCQREAYKASRIADALASNPASRFSHYQACVKAHKLTERASMALASLECRA